MTGVRRPGSCAASEGRWNIGQESQVETWPDDGHKFVKGCLLVGMPLSILCWWGLIALARMIW